MKKIIEKLRNGGISVTADLKINKSDLERAKQIVKAFDFDDDDDDDDDDGYYGEENVRPDLIWLRKKFGIPRGYKIRKVAVMAPREMPEGELTDLLEKNGLKVKECYKTPGYTRADLELENFSTEKYLDMCLDLKEPLNISKGRAGNGWGFIYLKGAR